MMPTPDQTRLEEARARPRIMELWWALRPLTSVLRFMQSGAHPDDEDSGLLAALAFRDGVNLSYACSTRGEGGQNDIGTEAGADLGALRTREMERACDVLGMRMYWHSESPEDAITDFGFSKSGEETLARWGRDRTLARFVEIVRTERPDILCPTFLDVPGQHGHHRAMTRAAHEVMAAAADPAFPSNLPVWRVKKLYLPAWSGAGQAYDDDEPPPPATLTVAAMGADPVSGWGWDRIGQMSRAYHRTQGMGRWVPAGGGRDYPLHLVSSVVGGADDALWAGVPRTVGDLGGVPGAGPVAEALRRAQAGIAAAVAAFPDFPAVAEAALAALGEVRLARAKCPEAARDEIVHRLDAKEVQLGHVIRHALGVEVRVRAGRAFLRPGEDCALETEVHAGEAEAVTLDWDLPGGWTVGEGRLRIGDGAAPSGPYPAVYNPALARAPAVVATVQARGEAVEVRLPFDAAPVVLPGRTAVLAPEAVVLNRRRGVEAFHVAVREVAPEGAAVALALPDGWSGAGMEVRPPEDVADGLYRLPLTLDGGAAATVRRIAYPHVAPTARARAAEVLVRVLEARVPEVRVGYVGAGNDRVGHWLAAMGADVTDLSDADLASDTALAAFDTVVVGIFAMRFRAGLLEAMPRLHRWTEAGGTLVTLYHRPWDNWDPNRVPPRRLEIGQPSLRWRVTDETAEVRHLVNHPLLSRPNRIGPEDWAGWVKERGLYFARNWDSAYTALLEMADPGEAPHRGALLVADVGRGRHVHTSLILHHQMENLVPGAFRIMANLIARRA
jgi:LmbE family N-acetylglucosaminyl deacetylase